MIDADQMDLSRTAPGFLTVSINAMFTKLIFYYANFFEVPCSKMKQLKL